ncbi:GNAT family N-acetyltransferase [Cohnella herbarum]|uniref:GNAT family N-acetyltransferase n=1 Tax=Cohnella herbarum TaxID=2728023 RepID=A0A7Z2VHJ9_9BACL|nr:GNAT family N-acetyltransferase [Cohnella herbarum]QJD83207.1 GNAT family N-acetyltransferase [Cohnella herbarum]
MELEIIQTTDHELIARLNKDVHDLHVSLYPEYFKPYNYAAMNDFYQHIMGNSKFRFYIIMDQEQSLGYVWIEIKDYEENAFRNSYKVVYVHQLSVAEEFRHKGLGYQLMSKVEQIAKENSIHKIELDYWVDNKMASSFYEKLDYKKYREFVFKGVE